MDALDLKKTYLPSILLLYLNSVLFGIYFFILLVLLFSSYGISEQEEWLIFITGWISVPVLSFIVVWFLKRNLAAEGVLGKRILAVLAVSNGLLLTLTVWSLYQNWGTAWIIGALPVVDLIALLLGPRLLKEGAHQNLHYPIRSYAGYVVPLFLLLVLRLFAGDVLTFERFIIAALLAMLAWFHPKVEPFPSGKTARIILDGLVALALILIVIDLSFPFDPHHHNYYLGPVNDLLHGKSLLVDINSQYGVGVIQFLALLFLPGWIPLTYQGFSFLISLLTAAQCITVYTITRHLTKSIPLSVGAVLIILLVSYYSGTGRMQMLPATGSLRFGLPIVLVALGVIRTYYPRLERGFSWLELLTLGVASLWSLETFVYTAAAYGGFLFYETLLQFRATAAAIQDLLTRIAKSILVILAFHAVFAITTYLKAGEWPDWSRYFDYIRLYSVEQLMTVPIPAWSPWVLMILVYFCSIMAILIRFVFCKDLPAHSGLKVIFALSVLGISEFTYYLGRSTSLYLLIVSIPAVLITFYWMSQISHHLTSSLRISPFPILYAVYFLTINTAWIHLPDLWDKAKDNSLVSIVESVEDVVTGNPARVIPKLRRVRAIQPTQEQVQEAIYLIGKYLPEHQRIPIFIDPEFTTETLLLTKRANVLPLSNPDLDTNVKSNITRALSEVGSLKPGDILILDKDFNHLNEIQLVLVNKLEENFDFKYLETTRNGISAVRLQ